MNKTRLSNALHFRRLPLRAHLAASLIATLGLLLLLLPVVQARAQAQTQTQTQTQTPLGGTVNTSAMRTIGVPIAVGATQLDIAVPVSAMSALRLQVIVPVTGASVSLIDPSGAVVIAPTDTRTGFLDGALLEPALPGGVFITPEVTRPSDGNWILRARFPAAPVPTVALLSLFAQSDYQVGLVLTGSSFGVGQPVPLGLLVLKQGQPIQGLAPSLSIRKNGVPVAQLQAFDNGRAPDFDGLANDGLYSQGYTFSEPGRYEIEGSVALSAADGSAVTRLATGHVEIIAASFSLNSVTGSGIIGAAACTQRLDVRTSANASLAGLYSTAATLVATNGRSLTKVANTDLAAPGVLISTVSFSANEIRSQLRQGGVFTVDPVDVVSLAGEQPRLELRQRNAYVFAAIALTQLCTDPVEIAAAATVNPVARAAFIGGLAFSLPIRVNNAGSYQVSFKVISAAGVEVGQFGLNRSFAAGSNAVGVSVLAEQLQLSDGPFAIESVLVTGSGGSAQASRVPVGNSSFSRWQFYPTIVGDLNGDLSVNAADRDLLLQFRNRAALVLGDRRDINGDGKIDLKDGRDILGKFCAAPNCPRN